MLSNEKVAEIVKEKKIDVVVLNNVAKPKQVFNLITAFQKANCGGGPGNGYPPRYAKIFYDHTRSQPTGFGSRRHGERRRSFCTGYG